AGAAPVSVEVHQDRSLGLENVLVEGGLFELPQVAHASSNWVRAPWYSLRGREAEARLATTVRFAQASSEGARGGTIWVSPRSGIIGCWMSTAQAVAPSAPSPLRQAGDRMLEAAPGILTWVLLLSPAWITLVFPSSGALVVAVVVLVFDLYWIVRSFTVI